MKDQYFADKRDFFKWDFLEDILDGCAELECFTNFTMLTPPDGSKEGSLTAYDAGNRRAQLFKFLQGCRLDGQQHVSKMQQYFQGKRYSYYPHGDDSPSSYTFECRAEYFRDIPIEKLQRALVFFDPDIGLEVGSKSYMRRVGLSKYLFDDSLATVSRNISDDSIIVVYQHLQRNKGRIWDDIEERCARLRSLVPADGVSFLTDRDVVFMATSRDPTIRAKLSTIVVMYAHRHLLDSGHLAAK